MRIRLFVAGKTSQAFIKDGCNEYEKRLKHYVPFEMVHLPDIKRSSSMTSDQMKTAESDLFRKYIKPQDYLILLDENGKQRSSVELAAFLENLLSGAHKEVLFAIGGAYGFDEQLKSRAQNILSLSTLTFPNQLCRLIFVEQLYRAFTILRKESYHHS